MTSTPSIHDRALRRGDRIRGGHGSAGRRFTGQFLLLLLLAALSFTAFAQPRTWLDRDRIELGETVTLNIATDGSGRPDYAPLRGDFEISGRSSRRSFQLVNGQASSRTLYAVALRPLHAGVITIPALQVGNQRSAPLTLVVAPASAPLPGRAGDEVFIRSEVGDANPYVQQTVGLVVRLYSAVPLVSGQLKQPTPDGASLRRVGQDKQYSRSVNGRRYRVIERHYQLIPERSGKLTIPPATFAGRGASGFFDDFFGGGRSALQAAATPQTLEVQPIPANAPQPWLALHDLQLRYRSTPQQLRLGSAATLVVEVTADGATAAQMPQLTLPPIDGVQVFAEPVQVHEGFRDGRPTVRLTRKFSLVPSRAGEVSVDGLRMDWWDVGSDRARTAQLPALDLQVGGSGRATGAAAAPAQASGTADADADAGAGIAASPAVPPGGPDLRPWIVAAVGFAALWLLTLLWALQRRRPGPLTPATASRVEPGRQRVRADALKRAIATGDFADVADALCALARPPAHDLDAVLERLDDPLQRDAIEAMQRARWGDGDGVAARKQLRGAFATGPHWREAAATEQSPLPPLYPGH